MFKKEKYELQSDEIAILGNYFQNHYNSREITLQQFKALLNTKF